MSIKEIIYDNCDEAIKFLEELALNNQGNGDYIFRGHNCENYKLTTTLSRFSSTPHESWDSRIDNLIESFRVGLAKLDISPFDSEDRHDWLEYARHHGVPTPVLDFSYSPYVSLFFAFNGIRMKYGEEKPKYVVIYAVNVQKLAMMWAKMGGNFSQEEFNEFMDANENIFKNGFPGGKLKFIHFPGRFNRRMQKQQGCFIYDTIDYKRLGLSELDDLIASHKEPECANSDNSNTPTAYKIKINIKEVSKVFSKLELMGINAGSLYLSADGVAEDVKNSYNYNSKVSYLRGVSFPFPDDTKM